MAMKLSVTLLIPDSDSDDDGLTDGDEVIGYFTIPTIQILMTMD